MEVKRLFFFYIASEFVFCDRVNKRVIKGQDAPSDKYRWAISMKGDIHAQESVTVCGASLIHRQWILSAAHCFYTVDGSNVLNQTDPSLWHIRAGARKLQTEYIKNEDKKIQNEGWHEETNYSDDLWETLLEALDMDDDLMHKRDNKRISEGHIHLHPQKIILHPKYNGEDIEWDIALIKLDRKINKSYIGKLVDIIELPKRSDSRKWPKIGQNCVLVGWGCQSRKGNIAKHGQLASLKVLKNENCEKIYDDAADLNRKHEFCAGSVSCGHGVCEGDSGSGLACKKNSKWVLAGIASATHSENPANFPGLFTRVSHFVPWIKKEIAKN